ncbi:MAG TPA: sigma 54-interacting transcriptional regulator [Polyangiaceae bacterium]|nr:sigma 54-interacting transcriptional regulator [Polyangiaceae bacterium]
MNRDDPFPDQPTVARPTSTAERIAHGFVLSAMEGPDAGRRFEIEASHPSRVLIGKSEVCDVRLADPAVSRRHAAVEVVGHRLRIRDLGSTNGTMVDGVAVVEGFLFGGEVVRIGSTALRVDRGESRAMASPPVVDRFGSTLGTSEAMRRLYPLCERLASSDVPLIIEGETGVGKEQLAESLHRRSARAEGPFVILDCTAVAPNLIESELFGHERGAFTGSVASHKGVFERAHGGALLIDEVGDMPLDLQPKLLRAIERLEVTRVGGQAQVRVDVRVFAATRRDLDREVQLGRFRDDLFHRLAVARVELPPLRERHGDIELLARHFLAEFGGDPQALPRELLRSWEDYPWPGNVRELRNAVARRLALGDLSDLARGGETLPPPSSAASTSAVHTVGKHGDAIAAVLALDLPLADARQRILSEFEQRYVEYLLEQHSGNVTRAAAAAGVTRRQLQRLKARFGGRDE